MSKAKWIWLGLLALVYAGFWSWYGGDGDPLTEAEGEELLTRMEQMYDLDREDAPAGSMLRNLSEMIPRDDGREFYAVNLETRKQGPEAIASEEEYTNRVVPLLLVRGGHPVFLSEPAGLMLGEYGNEIDRVAVVRYRSLRDLIDMILDPAMKDARVYKYGALEHTEVFITRPTLTFVQVRLIVGLALLVLAFAGLAMMRRREKRSARDNPTG